MMNLSDKSTEELKSTLAYLAEEFRTAVAVGGSAIPLFGMRDRLAEVKHELMARGYEVAL